ncbi:hypothetical protein Hamer_G018045 [Homarus americanus]|uniref:Uncharacterized protein n=1 Tax=Homarus americanus TaxID=6706 RepID=A0A8J5MZW4_HOMAM|nr:hypothetical protein Hamer_G018045 [Homarus americanus]
MADRINAHQVTEYTLHILLKKTCAVYMESMEPGDLPQAFVDWCPRGVKRIPSSRSLRAANFPLYVDSMTKLAPWFFSLAHANHARRVSIHIRYLAHEQNNGIVKSDRETVGLIPNPEALRRWMLAGPQVMRITAEFEASIEGMYRRMASETRQHEQSKNTQAIFTQYIKSLAEEKGAGTINTYYTPNQEEKAVQVKPASTVSSLKSDISLISRLYIACQSQHGNLDDLFRHENQACPSPLSISQLSKLRLGTKSDHLRCLERGIDLNDEYRKNSIKSHTRSKCGKGIRRRIDASANLSGNWKQFLRITANKVEFFAFLATHITRLPPNDTSSLAPCDHEEANTRIILQVSDAVNESLKILLRTVDTDVVVLVMVAAAKINIQELWVSFGTGQHDIAASLVPEKSQALPVFHAYIGDFAVLERFTILVYDHTNIMMNIDAARQELFTEKGRSMDVILLTRAALLEQHTKRAVYLGTGGTPVHLVRVYTASRSRNCCSRCGLTTFAVGRGLTAVAVGRGFTTVEVGRRLTAVAGSQAYNLCSRNLEESHKGLKGLEESHGCFRSFEESHDSFRSFEESHEGLRGLEESHGCFRSLDESHGCLRSRRCEGLTGVSVGRKGTHKGLSRSTVRGDSQASQNVRFARGLAVILVSWGSRVPQQSEGEGGSQVSSSKGCVGPQQIKASLIN